MLITEKRHQHKVLSHCLNSKVFLNLSLDVFRLSVVALFWLKGKQHPLILCVCFTACHTFLDDPKWSTPFLIWLASSSCLYQVWCFDTCRRSGQLSSTFPPEHIIQVCNPCHLRLCTLRNSSHTTQQVFSLSWSQNGTTPIPTFKHLMFSNCE